MRKAKSALDEHGIEALYHILEVGSARDDPTWDNSVDFLVATHLPNAEMCTVRQGLRSAPLNRAWLGDFDAYRTFLANEARLPDPNQPAIEPEAKFSRSFADLFANGLSVTQGVGGTYFNLLASPRGHCYQDHMAAMTWMPINLTIGRTARHEESRRTGEGEWIIGSMSTRYRGVAVTAAYIPQSRHAYIYAGLLDRDPARFRMIADGDDWTGREGQMQADLLNQLDRVAELIGGGQKVD